MYTVANTIYVDEDENRIAIELAKRFINNTIYSDWPSAGPTIKYEHGNISGTVNNSRELENREKIAHNVAMRLKDTAEVFC